MRISQTRLVDVSTYLNLRGRVGGYRGWELTGEREENDVVERTQNLRWIKVFFRTERVPLGTD